jgi:D-tyrosyl-tRNA(Tyr) deacylase
MRAVVQRVTKASVTVNDELISSIGKGLCVLVGISRDDTDTDIEYMVRKLLNLRLWDGDDGKRWMHSLSQRKYEILCVSQFTLYHVLKGNSPDFHHAMPASESKEFFDKFISKLKATYDTDLVKEGKFGNYMQVHIQGDGPVTIQLESPTKKDK